MTLFQKISENTFIEVSMKNDVVDPYDIYLQTEGFFYPLAQCIEHDVPEALELLHELTDEKATSNYACGNYHKSELAANTANSHFYTQQTSRFQTMAA